MGSWPPPFCREQNGTALAGPERTDPRDGVRNRQACLFTDEDHRFYLDWLTEHAGKTGCRVHAYVLTYSVPPGA